jgi:hypothetical protein
MSQKILIRRGLRSELLPSGLSVGELGFCTDTHELYIGSADGNIFLNNLDAHVKNLNDYSSYVVNSDWVPAFNKAFSDLAALGGGVLRLTRNSLDTNGWYTIKSMITIPSGVNIVGSGVGVTVIRLADGIDSDMIYFDTNDNCGISYLQLSGNVWNPNPSINRTGIIIGRSGLDTSNGNMVNLNIHDIFIRDIGGDGFRCYPNTWVYSVNRVRIEFCSGYGAFIESTDNTYTDFYIDAIGKTGLYVTGSNNRFSDMKIIFCGRGAIVPGGTATGSGNDFDAGVYDSGKRNQFANIECQENYGHGFVFDGAIDTTLQGMLSDANGYHMISTSTPATAVGYYFRNAKRITGDIKATIFKSTVSQLRGIYIEANCEDLGFDYTNDHTQDDINLSSTSILMTSNTRQSIYSSSKYVSANQYNDFLTSRITLTNEVTAYDTSVFQTGAVFLTSYTIDSANHEILGTTNWAQFPRLGVSYKSTISGHTYLVRVRVKTTVDNYWLRLKAIYDEGAFPTINQVEGYYSSAGYTDLYFTFQGADSGKLLVWVEDNTNNAIQHPFYVKDFAIVDITNATNVYYSIDTINNAVKNNYFMGSYAFGVDPNQEYNDFLASGTTLVNAINGYNDTDFNLSTGMLTTYTLDLPNYDILGTTNWSANPRLGLRGHSVISGKTYLARVRVKPTVDNYWLQLTALNDEAPYTVIKRISAVYNSTDYTDLTFTFTAAVTSSNFMFYMEDNQTNTVQKPFHAEQFALIDITNALATYSVTTLDKAVKNNYFLGSHTFSGSPASTLPFDTSSTEPASGNYIIAQQVMNSIPVAGGFIGWVCITAGTANKTLWATSTPYTSNTLVYSGNSVYKCVTGGTSGATAPTGTGTSISDGVCVWSYVGVKAVFKQFGVIST